MAKFEIIVRETRVLKYKIDAPTQQIGIDRIISDYIGNPIPYQTTRLSREIYAVDLPEPVAIPPYATPCSVTEGAPDTLSGSPPGLAPHPTVPVEPKKKIYKRGKKK